MQPRRGGAPGRAAQQLQPSSLTNRTPALDRTTDPYRGANDGTGAGASRHDSLRAGYVSSTVSYMDHVTQGRTSAQEQQHTNLSITVQKLNRLFEALSEEGLVGAVTDRAPFVVGLSSLLHQPSVAIRPGSEWSVATVLERVLAGELPVTKDAFLRKTDPQYGKPNVALYGDPTHPYVD